MYCIRATYLPREDMFFDEEHYERHHIPLTKSLLAGRVNYVRIGAEFNVTLQLDSTVIRSPCVFHLYVASADEVEAFRRFRLSPDVQPLRDDLPRYTNCKNEWTVSRYVEG